MSRERKKPEEVEVEEGRGRALSAFPFQFSLEKEERGEGRKEKERLEGFLGGAMLALCLLTYIGPLSPLLLCSSSCFCLCDELEMTYYPSYLPPMFLSLLSLLLPFVFH